MFNGYFDKITCYNVLKIHENYRIILKIIKITYIQILYKQTCFDILYFFL